MKYVQINSYSYGSTGGIMLSKHRELLTQGVDSYCFYGRGPKHVPDQQAFRIAGPAWVYLDGALTRFDGRAAFHSVLPTLSLIKRLDQIDPDVVHLHNLHGYYINIRVLFNWLAKRNQTTVWTLHDSWAMTGHCTFFDRICGQWESCCGDSGICPQRGVYPRSLLCPTKRNYLQKRKLFTSVRNLTIITPSGWLASLVRRSYLGFANLVVERTKIDTEIFRPTESDVRIRLGIGERKMVLGVASNWEGDKGLEDLLRLAEERIDCRVVIVGPCALMPERVPGNVVFAGKTESKRELAALYSAADVFFNPTRIDNYPTVNLEAEACGTPVVTYDVGGCRETIKFPSSRLVSGFQDAVLAIDEIAGKEIPDMRRD